MRKLLLLLAVVVAFSLTGFAQASGTQAGAETTTKTTTHKKTKAETGAAKESQLTGCLAKNAEGNGYMLTNGKYKKGVEVKGSPDFSGHVGHTVKLMGTWEKATEGEKGGAGAKGETMRTFDAKSLTHISDTCNTGKKGEKKAATEKSPGL